MEANALILSVPYLECGSWQSTFSNFFCTRQLKDACGTQDGVTVAAQEKNHQSNANLLQQIAC